ASMVPMLEAITPCLPFNASHMLLAQALGEAPAGMSVSPPAVALLVPALGLAGAGLCAHVRRDSPSWAGLRLASAAQDGSPRRGCGSAAATCSSPRRLGGPLQACPCGLLPSRFSYRHSAWRARGYVPMSDGTRRDGQACASHPPPKTVRRVAGLGLTHTAVQQTVVDVNSGPEEPIASISPSGCSQTRSTTSRLDRGS